MHAAVRANTPVSSICEPTCAAMPVTSRLRRARGAQVRGLGVAQRNAELVLGEPGRDVGMRARVDVRIHAQRDPRAHAERAGRRVEQLELSERFDVEARDVGRERRVHLRRGLAGPGVHDARGISARAQHARQLAFRDDVEACAEARQLVQDGEVAVRLHREADEMRASAERRVEGRERGLQRRARVHVAGRAVCFREGREPDLLRVQLVVAPGEELAHEPLSSGGGVVCAGSGAVAGGAGACGIGSAAGVCVPESGGDALDSGGSVGSCVDG